MARFLIPLGIFGVVVVFLWKGLSLNPRDVPSPLIDKAAPVFSLAQLHQAEKMLGTGDMLGKVWLLNVWASWCVSCRQEHPVLMRLAKENIVPIIGLNYKDKREDGIRWLLQHGNPYELIAHDYDGAVGFDYGVYGVPETYVIDSQGVIRHKHTGPVSPVALRDEIIPLVRKLQNDKI